MRRRLCPHAGTRLGWKGGVWVVDSWQEIISRAGEYGRSLPHANIGRQRVAGSAAEKAVGLPLATWSRSASKLLSPPVAAGAGAAHPLVQESGADAGRCSFVMQQTRMLSVARRERRGAGGGGCQMRSAAQRSGGATR